MSDENLPDAGFIYTGPNYWPHARPWQPKPGKCRACSSESMGNSSSFWQCTRPAKIEREVLHHGERVTFGYCGQHDPVKVAERRAARDAKWRREWDAKNAKWSEEARLAKLSDAAVEALKQIARGHNDPRSLAIETLSAHAESLD